MSGTALTVSSSVRSPASKAEGSETAGSRSAGTPAQAVRSPWPKTHASASATSSAEKPSCRSRLSTEPSKPRTSRRNPASSTGARKASLRVSTEVSASSSASSSTSVKPFARRAEWSRQGASTRERHPNRWRSAESMSPPFRAIAAAKAGRRRRAVAPSAVCQTSTAESGERPSRRWASRSSTKKATGALPAAVRTRSAKRAAVVGSAEPALPTTRSARPPRPKATTVAPCFVSAAVQRRTSSRRADSNSGPAICIRAGSDRRTAGARVASEMASAASGSKVRTRSPSRAASAAARASGAPDAIMARSASAIRGGGDATGMGATWNRSPWIARTMSASAAPAFRAASAARARAGFRCGSAQSPRGPSQRETASATRSSAAATASTAPAASRSPRLRAASACRRRAASGSDRLISPTACSGERAGETSPSIRVAARVSAWPGSRRFPRAAAISARTSSPVVTMSSVSAQSSHASIWTSVQPSAARRATTRSARSISRRGRCIAAARVAKGNRMGRTRRGLSARLAARQTSRQ